MAHLEAVHLGVGAALPQQLGVGAFFGNPAFLQHYDPIRAAHNREPVADDQRGASAHQALQRLLDDPLRFRLDGGGRLVQDEDLRVGEEGARDADPLPLPAGEPHAAFPDLRLPAVRKLFLDELERVRRGRRLARVLERGVPAGVPDVLQHRPAEEERLLEHHPDVPPQALLRHGADLPPVHAHPALPRVPEAGDQVDERALARAAASHHRHHLARAHIQADTSEHRPSAVAEMNVFQGHPALHSLQGHRVRRILDGHRLIQQLEDPGAGRRAPLDQVIDLG